MSVNAIPDKYRSDHLFITVGTNPLPNYVSARLLAKPKATVWLLYSDGAEKTEPSTQKAAEQLEEALYENDDKELTIELEPIPSADNMGIEKRVRDMAGELTGSIGLNYSGGTKPMSVHSYRTIERVLSLLKRESRPVFSYLDPRKLALRIDGDGTQTSELFYILKEAHLRAEVEMSLEELTALHGYEPSSSRKNWANPENTDGLLQLCEAIAQVHTTHQGIKTWKSWTGKSGYKSLPTAPELQEVRNALDNLCGGSATPEQVAAKLLPDAHSPRLSACQNWFQGDWLEEHSLACVAKVARKFQIKSKEKNLTYYIPPDKEKNFELDVAAMIGYQLFAISCKASKNEEKALKLGLFEIFTRARQLGGDEARVALVCCADDKAVLENEIKREWQAEGKIRVFDRHDLRDLASAFELWFQTANG